MYWRDITTTDTVTIHNSHRDGRPYHTVNNGPVYWMTGEHNEAARILDHWAKNHTGGRKPAP